jgi:26S proteasome regulatory subunit N5
MIYGGTETDAWYQASDLATTSRALVAIVTLCKEAGDWSLLNDQVLLLSKKHAQLKQATTKMVQVVMEFLDDTPNIDVKLSVIETLRTVTEGKVSHVVVNANEVVLGNV